MKLKFFTLIILSFVLLSNRGGRNAPATGAPIDGGGHCNQCHAGGNFNHEVMVSLLDANGEKITDYMPNTQYTIVIQGTEANNNAKAFGFQLVMLDSLTNKQAGTFDSLGQSVRKAKFNTKDYIMQSSPRADGTFTVKWTSPEKSTGGLKAFVALLATNTNGNTSGDKSISKSFSFGESITSALEDVRLTDISIYPNPAKEFIYISGPTDFDIFSVSGEKLKFMNNGGWVSVSSFQSGVYYVKATGFVTKRFIKIK